MSYWRELEVEIKDSFAGESAGVFLFDEPLAGHTTLGVGGKADLLYAPEGPETLARFLELTSSSASKIFIMGGGSNMLCSDAGFRGAVIKITGDAMGGLAVDGESIRAGAGVSLKATVMFSADSGLSGLEFAAGIPGTIGGAAIVNAGAYEGNIGELITSVEGLNTKGDEVKMEKADIKYDYRDSSLKRMGAVITKVRFSLSTGERSEISVRIEDNMKERNSGQPLDKRSAGCVFKNPKEGPAWRLIEEAGLKGKKRGGAIVSEKHTNFIVNDGTAKADDYRELMEEIQETVEAKLGVSLEREIIMLGFDDESD